MNSVAALLIFLLLRFPSPTSAHHIVFEEIGEMAGALSYIHAVIPVNISGLDRAANTFRSQVDHLRRNYNLAQTEIDKTIRDAPDPDDEAEPGVLCRSGGCNSSVFDVCRV